MECSIKFQRSELRVSNESYVLRCSVCGFELPAESAVVSLLKDNKSSQSFCSSCGTSDSVELVKRGDDEKMKNKQRKILRVYHYNFKTRLPTQHINQPKPKLRSPAPNPNITGHVYFLGEGEE